jgi:hypothetical protein
VKYTLTLIWGGHKCTYPIKERKHTYEFANKQMMNAFICGANECALWDGFKITKCSDPSVDLGQYGD